MKTDTSPNLRVSRIVIAAAVTASYLFVSACGSTSGSEAGTASTGSAVTGAATAAPRLALTYDGGIAVLDGKTLELKGDVPIAGYNRLNAAGDGRHALVTTSEGFQVLDMGTWTDSAGSWQAEPHLTDLIFKADKAGHVVRHADKTILYADGTGETTVYETDDLLDEPTKLPATEVVPAEEAHHGVSIVLEDDTLLTTIGNSQSRSGIIVLDKDRKEIARNGECPSIHGEGTAANEIAVFGCSNGVLIYEAGNITKIAAPDKYGRMGNAYATDINPIAAGDYNSDPDSEGYLLRQLALINTQTKTMKVVDLPEGIEYTWRDVARGPDGEIILLGSDGFLHTLDPITGGITSSLPVIDPWDGPAEWQDPHPALTVLGAIAYVTDPVRQTVHGIDLATGNITTSGKLPGIPNEITVVEG